MAKGGISRPAIEETQYRINTPWAKVREEKKWGVEHPGHNNGKAAVERLLAMLWENQMECCLRGQNATAQNAWPRWRRKGTGAPPPDRPREPTPDPTLYPPRYVYIHTPHPSAQFFNRDAYATDRKRDKDFNPDVLTDEGISTG